MKSKVTPKKCSTLGRSGITVIIKGTISAIRPIQQIKNGAVVLGAVATGNVVSFHSVGIVAILVFSWILLSGSVYLLNDLSDYEFDKIHPVKSKRAIASGQISRGTGALIGSILAIVGIVIQYQMNFATFLIGMVYLTINILYSFSLKNFSVLDILAVTSGFVLRGLSGIFVVDAEPSVWFILLSLFGSLLLVSSKRQNQKIEENENKGSHREAASGYSSNFLTQIQTMCSTGLLISYVMMTEEKFKFSQAQHIVLQFSIAPFLATILYLNLYISEHHESDVTRLILTKRPLALSAIVWLIFFITSLVI